MNGPVEAFGFVFVLFILGFIALFVSGAISAASSIQKRKTTEEDYRSALAQYRTNPSDQGLRQAALEAGRLYSRYTRNQYGNAYFDESGIKNDLDSIATMTSPKAETLKGSIEGRLQTLEGLWNQGLITENEYQNRRQAILDEV